MPATQTASPPPAVWRELWEQAQSESGDRALLGRLVELWRARRGAAGAALYLEQNGALCHELSAGDGDFPERLEGGPPAGCEVVELPAGALVATAPAEGAPDAGAAEPDALDLLLAGRVRLRRLEQQLKDELFQANYRGVELEALYDVGLAIASTLDLERLGEEILLRAVSLLDARRGALYLLDGDRYRLDRTFGGPAGDELGADDPGLERLLAGRQTGPGLEDLLPGARHLLGAAIESDGRRRGALVMGDKESRSGVGPFGSRDRRTLALFANQAAIALENARLHRQALEKERLEREMELAAEIQRQILPKSIPEIAGYDLAGWNRPARQVGGDYYDLVTPASGRLTLALGDVTGKGVPAALMVSTLHSALMLLRDRTGVGAELLERLNRHIFDSSAANKFITLFVAELDGPSGRLDWVNAGHNPALALRAGGGVERCGASGLPIGLMTGGTYTARTLELGPGDLFCVYSDGITEAAAPDDEEFGEQRLLTLLADHRTASLDLTVAALDAAVRDFSGDQPQGDDQTIILLRRQAA